MNYYTEIFNTIIHSLRNNYRDNWDYVRFGKEKATSIQLKTKGFIKDQLNQLGIIRANDLTGLVFAIEKEIGHFEYLFQRLENRESRELLVQLLAYRILGYKKVKLPLSNPDYWKNLSRVEGLCNKTDFIDPDFNNFKLYHFNLNSLGYPISLYLTPLGILIDFVIKQYEYQCKEFSIITEEGDVVIDGGGCWGDTALYFANAVGKSGKVFSFEFIPFNVNLFQKNISLNPVLSDIISLIPHPLWENSNVKVYMKEHGPASRISLEPFPDQTGRVASMSIDDLVNQRQLNKLDFIKLDIEGAELMALKGAIKSLRQFRPKLAVALYHYSKDFNDIPKYLDSLELGYKFYLSHCTIHKEETILFATTR